MKIGYRKPSIKKSIKASTTGRIKRTVKSSVNPIYGKKGVGFYTDPERSIKNSIYHKTSFDTLKGLKGISKTKDNTNTIVTIVVLIVALIVCIPIFIFIKWLLG